MLSRLIKLLAKEPLYVNNMPQSPNGVMVSIEFWLGSLDSKAGVY